MSDEKMIDWKLIIIATTGSGHVAIHETRHYGTEEAARTLAKNLAENNRYVTVGVTVVGQG